MNYQCGHSIGRHHETAADGYPICPKCLHTERDKLKAVLVSIRTCLSATKGGLLEDSREEAIARLSLIFDDCAEGLKE